MSQIKVIECDKCGTTDTCLNYESPDGWGQLRVELTRSEYCPKRPSKTYDLCPKCIANLL